MDAGTGYVQLQHHEDRVQRRLRHLVLRELGQERDTKLALNDQEVLIQELTSELIGFGPIGQFMEDDTVSEVMINGPDTVFVERLGCIEPTGVTFRDREHLLYCIERMLDPVGAAVNESEPCANALLPDGSRLNVIIPPLALNGPIVTIRKQLMSLTMDELVALGTMTRDVADVLTACVRAHVNIIISGGTSTGKTTLVTALSSNFSPDERVITIENIAELQLAHADHWVRLVARHPNIEGRGAVEIRDLVRNALRMRPDRVVLGEASGAEALDMIQAMHIGHEGFITVMHANSPEAAMERLETLMLMSGVELPPHACRAQIASAIELVVHLERFPDGVRRVSKLSEVTGLHDQGIATETLMAFHVEERTPDGLLVGTQRWSGRTPTFLKKFNTYDVPMPNLMATEGAMDA
jgi:pilus assembly protein CpaF